MTDVDVIDTLVGIEPGSALDAIRNRRPTAREQAQASYRALFEPEGAGETSLMERFAVAVFVVGLHGGAPKTAAHYAAGLTTSGASEELRAAIDGAIMAAKGQGPYGSYPAGPLSREDAPGPTHRIAAETRRCWDRASPRRSITRTCWCSTRAMPLRPRCKPCWMLAGRPPAL